MSSDDLLEQRRGMVEAARALLGSGLLSLSKHGNLSTRVPAQDAMLLSSVSTMDLMTEETQALVSLDDGRILSGYLDPVTAEIIDMHSVVYRLRPEIGGVIHTHSPHATAFALAGHSIERVYEGLLRWDISEPIPVAAYGPRGSRLAVDNIQQAIQGTPGCKAILLQNHGVLAFDRDLPGAIRVHIAMEEAAQLSLLASQIGAPLEIPRELAEAALQRRDEFARA
jgi:ribulose-5-phosphate 4-epimerase/fuculose-1-phosphate aldolase